MAATVGKHVSCEKPLGITVEEVDRILKDARRSDAILPIVVSKCDIIWLQGAVPLPFVKTRRPFADIRVAASAALTTIMGSTAVYERRMVTWNELGVSV